MKQVIRYTAWAGLAATLLLVCAGFSCDKPKSSAVAVNRYAEALSHFQDAEIIAHDQGHVDNATHTQILKAEKLAAKAGQDLDTAIALAAQGADASAYVTNAEKTFTDLLDAVKPTNRDELIVLAKAAGDLLENALTLIGQIHINSQPAAPRPTGVSFWIFTLGLGVFGMAVSVGGVIQLLLLIESLEPEAFDLVMKLAASLKGKTTEEVLAMNETLFGKVQQTADDELAKGPQI